MAFLDIIWGLTFYPQVKILCFPILRRKTFLLQKMVGGLCPHAPTFPPMSTALFLKDFAKFKRRHQCWSFSDNFIKRLQHKCFPVNFARLLGTFFVQNTSIQVLLNFPKVGLQHEYFPVNLHQNTYEQLLLHFL